MIAACPKCGARYRIERQRLAVGSVRLRCARCEAVFRVRPPEAARPEPPAPAPAAEPDRAPPASIAAPPAPAAVPSPRAEAERVLLAMPEGELARRTAEALAARGLVVLRANDGVEAMLEIQRKLPRAVVLAADLAKMFGFQICEVVKRNESLRSIWVVLVGAIHHPERYRRAPGELYGADAYVEGTELPDGLMPLLAQAGLRLPPVAPPAPPLAQPQPARAAPAPAPPPEPAPLGPAVARPAPRAAPAAAPPRTAFEDSARPARVSPAVAAPPTAGPPRAPRADGLAEERAKAERLARIVISDIVLYNEARFAAALRAGNVLEAMAADLAEGRTLFEERIDARVRAERDHLKDELLLRAKAREKR